MKAYMKKIISTIVFLVVTITANAQQESLFSFYRNHMNLVNPAYAGAEDETLINSSYRKQWAGIEEAPETQAVSFGTPLGKSIGFGVSMVHDKTFIEKQTFLGIDFSYKLDLNATHKLYMGLKVGGNFYDVNTSGLQTYNVMTDPALESINNFNPNVGLGFYLKHDSYYVSLSSPRVLNTERADESNGFASTATDRPHIYLSSGYNYIINEKFDFIPSFMLRYVNGAPLNADITASFEYDKTATIGIAYRTSNVISGLFSIVASKRLTLGYAYESALESDLKGRANGTHEFILKFKI